MSTVSDSAFADMVRDAVCYADVVRDLGLRLQGSNYKTIKRRAQRQGLSTAHFAPWNTHRRRQIGIGNSYPLDEILIENSTYLDSNNLKSRLVREGLLKYECVKCGNQGTWNNEPLTLQLDHVNGNHRDNRIDNLCILCPNCHTQTKTHSGKRHKKSYECPTCHKEYKGYGKTCQKCRPSSSPSKIKWPADKELSGLVWSMPGYQVCEQLQCSQTLLRKYCKKHRVSWPPVGYWNRRATGQSHEEALIAPARIPKRQMGVDDLEKARSLRQDGLSNRKIAATLGFCHTTVGRQLKLVP